jgi:hypothetical protein
MLALPAAAAARRRALLHLRRSSYRGLVGQPFTVQGARAKLRLVTVRDLNRHQAGSDNAFALIFQAPRGAPRIPEAVPTLHHPALGSFALLLCAGAPSSSGLRYAAIVNRLHA